MTAMVRAEEKRLEPPLAHDCQGNKSRGGNPPPNKIGRQGTSRTKEDVKQQMTSQLKNDALANHWCDRPRVVPLSDRPRVAR